MQRTERVIHYLLTIALQIMLESFRATQEWLHTSSLRFYFTCIFEEQNIPFTPIFRHIRTRFAFVDIFEFATNKAFDVCIGMSMLFWSGSFLKSRRQHIFSIWCRHETAAEDEAVLPLLTHPSSVLFVGGVRVYWVAAVWDSFKSVFVFPDSWVFCQSEYGQQVQSVSVRVSSALGSGPRYMIWITLFCTLRQSKNLRPCENRVRFSHGRNVQKRVTKSDTSGDCLSCIDWTSFDFPFKDSDFLSQSAAENIIYFVTGQLQLDVQDRSEISSSHFSLFWGRWLAQWPGTENLCSPLAILRGTVPVGGLTRVLLKAEVCSSFFTTTVWEQHPRSHHKGTTGRVRTGDQRYPVLCLC